MGLSDFLKKHKLMQHKTKDVKLNEEITSDIEIGGIEEQEILPKGMSMTSFLKALLQKTFYPTLNSPSFSLTSNVSSSVEAGTIDDITLTHNFDRGTILGKLVGGVWEPSTIQDYRAGEATNYTINGTDMNLVNNRTLCSEQFCDGTNSYSSVMTYAEGPQPTDSLEDNYSSSLAAGGDTSNLTIYGRRNLFYGLDNDAIDSDNIRLLSNTSLNPSNGTEFTINITAGTENVVFAYPSTLQDVTSVIYVEGLGSDVKSSFVQTTVSVEGANGYTGIDYKVYKFTPVEPFEGTATYNVTI